MWSSVLLRCLAYCLILPHSALSLPSIGPHPPYLAAPDLLQSQHQQLKPATTICLDLQYCLLTHSPFHHLQSILSALGQLPFHCPPSLSISSLTSLPYKPQQCQLVSTTMVAVSNSLQVLDYTE